MPPGDHARESGVTWMSTRLGVNTDCLIAADQWGTPARENIKSSIARLEDYLELSIKAEHMYLYDSASQLLDILKRKSVLLFSKRHV